MVSPPANAQSAQADNGRIVGCLLGGALGDALGAPLEFLSLEAIRREHGPHGATGMAPFPPKLPITDDTQMTLFTAEGLVLAAQRGTDPLTTIDAAYQRWLVTQNVRPLADADRDGWLMNKTFLYARRAPGSTCLSALACEARGTVANPINNSKGCGGVMRVAPIGLVAGEDSFDLAARAAALTHGHPSGYLSAGAFARVISAISTGADLHSAIATARSELETWPRHEETVRAIDAAIDLAESDAPSSGDTVELLGGGWVGEEALAIALYCALRHPDDPVAALLLAVNHSGDSDSTGAICGNLMGAWLGAGALPAAWSARVEGHPEIVAMAELLATVTRKAG